MSNRPILQLYVQVRLFLQHFWQVLEVWGAVIPLNTVLTTAESGMFIHPVQISALRVTPGLRYADREQVARQVQDVWEQPGQHLHRGM